MLKKVLSTILCIISLLSIMPSAFAYETDDDDYIGADISIDEAYDIAKAILERDEGKDLAQIASENNAIVWHYNPYGEAEIPGTAITLDENDDFESAVDKLFSKYAVNDDLKNEYISHISLGYMNLVTGEEYYYGEDTGIVSASLFKVPENMIFCDKIANGEMTFDTEINGEPYKFLQYRTLSRSDNDRAFALYSYIDGYIGLKKLQRAYIGEEPYADGEYIDGGDITYTPKNVIFALKTVYDDPERFNGIIQNMMQAQPYEYFKMFQRDYVVAQKYGFINQTEATGEHSYINCCGIVYTDQPIAIVCMTDNISKAYDVIGEYACIAAQYTDLQIEKQKRAEEEEEAAAIKSSENSNEKTAEESSPVSTPILEQVETSQNSTTDKDKETKMSLLSCMAIGLICIVALYCLVIIFRRNGGGEVNGFFAVLAVIFASLAMTLCVIANQRGTLYAKPDGDPGETVSAFFTAIKGKDYQTAYSYLEDYSDLGLSNTPSSTEGQWMQQALTESYDYFLMGNAEIDKLSAKQRVTFRYLDLASVEEDAKAHVQDVLKKVVDEKSKDELYDENNQYKSSVLDEVYNRALSQSLEDAEDFYKTVELTVDLNYVNGKWMMTTSTDLINYLMGGAGA